MSMPVSASVKFVCDQAQARHDICVYVHDYAYIHVHVYVQVSVYICG